jgi:protein-disulfide isomerase
MRTVLMCVLPALAWIAAAPAPAQERPCAAVRTATLPPCDAPAAKAPSPRAVATIDGKELEPAAFDAELRKKIEGVDAAVAEARRAALEDEIVDVRLHLESERRGVSFQDLWESEVLKKTPPASQADIETEFERVKKWLPNKTIADLRPRLEALALVRNREKREREVADSLNDRFPLVRGADPNGGILAGDVVLATVGGRPITAASAATRLDAAAYFVRRDLYYQTSAAVEKAASARFPGRTVETHVEARPAPVLALDLAGAPARGRADAPVTLVEFADFECPHCAHGFEQVEEIKKTHGDQVRYVFRNFPLPSHEHALKAAEAGLAAAAQGRFFEIATLMFRNQNALDIPSLKRYAAEAGCDPARFAADLDSGRFGTVALLERREGDRVGVAGTPSFFVNGVPVLWDGTVASLRTAVGVALARAGVVPSPRDAKREAP